MAVRIQIQMGKGYPNVQKPIVQMAIFKAHKSGDPLIMQHVYLIKKRLPF